MLSHAAISGSMKISRNLSENGAGGGIYSQAYCVGNFYIVINLQSSSEEVDLELGRDVVAKIEDVITQTPAITPAEIVEMQKEQFADGIKLNLLIAKVDGQKLSLSKVGEVGAKLLRKGKIINLSGEGNVLGQILHDDLLVLGTEAFFSEIKSSELFQDPNISASGLRDLVLPKVESFEDDSRVAALFIRVDLTLGTESETSDTMLEVRDQKLDTTERFGGKLDVKSKIFASLSAERNRLFVKNRVAEFTSKSKYRKFFYLALVVLVTLISLVAYQLRSKSLEVRSQSVAKIEKITNEGLASSSKLLGLNDQIARETLIQTKKDVLNSTVSTFGDDWKKQNFSEKKRILEILSNLDAEINRSAHIYEAALTDFSDFSLLKSGVKIVSSSLHDGKIIVLDGANGAIYSLATSNKAAAIVGGDFRDGKFLDFSGENVYVLTPNGIYLKKGDVQGNKQVLKRSERWKDIKSLAAFGGNLYLLDPGSNQIWKYQGTETGFAEITNYLKEGLSLDLKEGISMQLDGYIYVLSASGNFVRLGSGSTTEFSLTGMPDELTKISNFYTSDDCQNLYFWDSGKSRVVVFDKKGVYRSQYQILNVSSKVDESQTSNAVILADESVKKIFLISGSKVFSVDIKD